MQSKTQVTTRNPLIVARAKALQEFGNIAHRLEHVASLNDVVFINDSKATDINSTSYSLDNVEGPIIWITGASDVDIEYDELKALVKQKVKAIVVLGNAGSSLFRLIEQSGFFTETADMEEALKSALEYSEAGDTVLFSPSCSGFGMFQDYKDRGEQFKRSLKKLI